MQLHLQLHDVETLDAIVEEARRMTRTPEEEQRARYEAMGATSS